MGGIMQAKNSPFYKVQYMVTCHHAPDPDKPGLFGLFRGTRRVTYKVRLDRVKAFELNNHFCKECKSRIDLPLINPELHNTTINFPSLVSEIWTGGFLEPVRCHEVSFQIMEGPTKG